MNPLLVQLLAASPPLSTAVDHPVDCCAGCGQSADPDDYQQIAGGGPLCLICRLGYLAAWQPERVRLALIPELHQGALNAVVIRMRVTLLERQDRAQPIPGPAAPPAAEIMRQHHLMTLLQQRVADTHRLIPFTVSPYLLRQTLLALPDATRESLLAELAGLRYLPDPDDREVDRFCLWQLHPWDQTPVLESNNEPSTR
ncbi:MAG: hypothetical protein V2J55_16280 [Candidatus Competibacteraceae bacterium]|nr:hypothetical protein [Candidatus Competibacteraceae bacterium]